MIVTVDWADPINSPASEIMDKVKVLYVKNLASTVTEECLVTTFSAYGEVEKAKKLKGFFLKYHSYGFQAAQRFFFSNFLWLGFSGGLRTILNFFSVNQKIANLSWVRAKPSHSLITHFRLRVCPFQTEG